MNKQELLLTLLIEECAEVAQRCTKALRFGLDEVEPEQELTNEERIVYELNDLMAVLRVLGEEGILKGEVGNDVAISKKREKIYKWMQYSRKVGALKDESVELDKDIIYLMELQIYSTKGADEAFKNNMITERQHELAWMNHYPYSNDEHRILYPKEYIHYIAQKNK